MALPCRETLSVRRLLLAALGAAFAASALPALTQPAIAQQASAAAASLATPDQVVFRSGRVVEGEILEETETTVRMRIVVAGISTVTSYSKSEILEIKRGVNEPEEGAENTPATTPADSRGTRSGRGADASSSEPGENAARIYTMKIEGQFGRDISQTPFAEAFAEARKDNPDAIIIEMDSESVGGFDGLFVANIEKMTPDIERAIAEGTRVVFWIDRAQGGAAFLPFSSPEIYFKSDGRLGGIGTLQDFDMGNKRVNEKQISLRLGHAEGLAITGGYAPELIRAMARQDYWLAARIRGGQVEYMQRKPTQEELDDGWIVLSDDGKGANEDKLEDVVRGRGNDVLNLDAEMAARLGVSDGTADSLDQLVFLLGLGRDYVELSGKSQQVLESWSDNIERAQRRIERAMEDNAKIPMTTRRDIGRKIQLLREVRSVLTLYEEVFDSDGSQRSQIDIQIEQLRLAMQRARN